jgi:hypothetical protein
MYGNCELASFMSINNKYHVSTKSLRGFEKLWRANRTWQELEYRLDVLLATKGAHIEVY